jgi:hypothetical protein
MGTAKDFRRIPGESPIIKEQERKIVLSLVMSLALIAVIVLSLAAGVGLGYAIIFGILYIFDRSRQSIKVTPARILTTSAGND